MFRHSILRTIAGLLVACTLAQTANATDGKHKGWKKLHNVNGWSVEYPPDWMAEGDPGFDEENVPEKSNWVTIRGPRQKAEKEEWHGRVTIRPWKDPSKVPKKTSKEVVEYTAAGPRGVKRILFENGEASLGERKGHQVVYFTPELKEKGTIRLVWLLAVPFGDGFLRVEYAEMDGDASESINSPKDWKYRDIAREVLSTLRFQK
jgi:hypothetical protein